VRFSAVVRTGIAVIALLLLAPANASAAGWRFAGTITTHDAFSGVSATVDATGRALFTWRNAFVLRDRARPPRGAFTPARTLAAIAPDATPVAGNRAGEAVQAWGESDVLSSYSTRVRVALSPPRGDFASAQTIYDGDDSEQVCDVATAISDSGVALVVFSVASGEFAPCRLYASVRQPGSSSFAAAVELSAGNARQLQVAADARGNAIVAWINNAVHQVETARYRAGAGFQPTQSLPAPGTDATPKSFGPLLLRVSAPTGRAIVAFPTVEPRVANEQIAATVGNTANGFRQPSQVSETGTRALGHSQRFAAAAGVDGTVAVAWRGGPDQHRRFEVARVGPRAISISSRNRATLPGEHALELAMAIDRKGLVLIATTYLVAHGNGTRVEATSGTAQGRFAKPQVLSRREPGAGALPVLAISSRGRGFYAWLHGARPTVRAAISTASDPGHFGRARQLGGNAPAAGMHFVPGVAGTMFAVVGRTNGHWQLLAHGER
jgi:hypothetical protein